MELNRHHKAILVALRLIETERGYPEPEMIWKQTDLFAWGSTRGGGAYGFLHVNIRNRGVSPLALLELAKEGLVQPVPGGTQRQQYFTLTDAGRKRLDGETWTAQDALHDGLGEMALTVMSAEGWELRLTRQMFEQYQATVPSTRVLGPCWDA